jgi:hypothetical protein
MQTKLIVIGNIDLDVTLRWIELLHRQYLKWDPLKWLWFHVVVADKDDLTGIFGLKI